MSALHYCHEVKNFSHRDIKPENIMLDEFGKLYLCDFGVGQFFEADNDVIRGAFGTVRFMAPEMLGVKQNSELHGRSIDMWAAGVTLFNLLTKEYPFNGTTFPQIRDQLHANNPPLEKIKNPKIRELIKSLFEKDPSKRPRTIDIIENSWLTKDGTDPIDLDLSSVSGSPTPSVTSLTERTESKRR